MNQGMPMWPNNPNMNPNMGGWQEDLKIELIELNLL